MARWKKRGEEDEELRFAAQEAGVQRRSTEGDLLSGKITPPLQQNQEKGAF